MKTLIILFVYKRKPTPNITFKIKNKNIVKLKLYPFAYVIVETTGGMNDANAFTLS